MKKSFDAVGINLDQLGSFKSSKGIARKSINPATQRCLVTDLYLRAIYPPDISRNLNNPKGLDRPSCSRNAFWKPGHGSRSSV